VPAYRLGPGDLLSLAREVHVLGEVKVPQSVGFRDEITLLQALARAEGVLFTGRLREVQLVRTEADHRQAYVIDVMPILGGQQPDVRLEPGDVVYVPPTGLAVWSRTILQLLPFLQPIATGANLVP
jgi:protein involved in polysaccharide export with SLBB domain